MLLGQVKHVIMRKPDPMTYLWYALAFFIIVFDQWTKQLAETHLTYNMPVEVLPVFDWTLRYNTGAAFSFLHDAGGWQRWFFSAIAISVSLALAVWIWRNRNEHRILSCGLSLVLGGAIGNLYDRLMHGHVVDFISVHWQDHYFPAFNIADSAITIGAGLLLLDSFLQARREKAAQSLSKNS
jgi:signal peptidase II